MVWHDCKTDPPKKFEYYLLVYSYYHRVYKEQITTFTDCYYDPDKKDWVKRIKDSEGWYNWERFSTRWCPLTFIKWAEVDLSEVD